ncbi:MAG: THUMP domain-containing protein [Candidatus Hodarchaeota archaeon]
MSDQTSSLTLLISSARTFEKEALSEAWQLFKESGYEPLPQACTIPGLSLLVILQGALGEIVAVLKKEIRRFDYCLKFVPLQKIVSTNLSQIADAARELLSLTSPNFNKWRITLNRRHTNLPRAELLKEVSKVVEQGTVDLNNPSWIIQIEILGKITGISILQPNQIVSWTQKERNIEF